MRTFISIAAGVAATCFGSMWLTGEAGAQGLPNQDSLALFENLLRNPDEAATNLAYAQALQAEGHIDEARQAYQKVLVLSPNNPTALAALAYLGQSPAQGPPPAQTDYTLRAGIAYESNSALRDASFRPFVDELAFGEFTVNDLRPLGDLKVQTNLDIFSNIHNRYSPGDISYLALDSGPVWDLAGNGKLRTAVGGELLLQGVSPIDGKHSREFEFGSGNFIFNYFPPGGPYLQSVNLMIGYDNFRESEAFRSGVVARVTAPFVIDDLLPFQSTLLATPGYAHDGAQQQPSGILAEPAHFDELNLDLLSLTPLAVNRFWSSRIVGKTGVFLAGDLYDGHDSSVSHDRRDFQVIPMIGLRLVDFAYPRLQLDLDYHYDRNFSSEFVERYDDHIVTLTLTYRF